MVRGQLTTSDSFVARGKLALRRQPEADLHAGKQWRQIFAKGGVFSQRTTLTSILTVDWQERGRIPQPFSMVRLVVPV